MAPRLPLARERMDGDVEAGEGLLRPLEDQCPVLLSFLVPRV